MEGIFRKKSMERLSSPEQLTDYLHVTSPSVWVLLGSVILVLGSLFLWSATATIESYLPGSGISKGGMLTITFAEEEDGGKVEPGMEASVGQVRARIEAVGRDPQGRVIASARAPLPDGQYEVRVGYRSTQVLRILFN